MWKGPLGDWTQQGWGEGTHPPPRCVTPRGGSHFHYPSSRPTPTLPTPQAFNGFAGMAIMPRFSTVIPYDASTMAEAQLSQDDRYPPKPGVPPVPFADVIAGDAKRAVLSGLLPLRMDGWVSGNRIAGFVGAG